MKDSKIDGIGAEISFSKWRAIVDKQMLDTYSIAIEDSGIDDDYLTVHWNMKQSPLEFIEWFGNKNDLDRLPSSI